MSSRYSKPCNLIQSFIYQQYSFHLLQLCVRAFGRLLSWYGGAREGLKKSGGPQSAPTGGSGFSGRARSFSHRWEIQGKKGDIWQVREEAFRGSSFCAPLHQLAFTHSATQMTGYVKGRVTGSSRSCLHHLLQGKTADLWTAAPWEKRSEERGLGKVTINFLKDGAALSHLSECVGTSAHFSLLLSLLSPPFPFLFFLEKVFGKKSAQRESSCYS